MKEAVKLYTVCISSYEYNGRHIVRRPSLHFTTLCLMFCLDMKLGLSHPFSD